MERALIDFQHGFDATIVSRKIIIKNHISKDNVMKKYQCEMIVCLSKVNGKQSCSNKIPKGQETDLSLP
jgi:hypothetical protein